MQRQKALLFGSAAALRLLLYIGFPTLPSLLCGRVEISTPVTSFKRLQEGLFLYTHNVSPYDGGVFHQAPLLLPLFALIPTYGFSFLTTLLYIGLDLLCADAIIQIANSGESSVSVLFASSRKNTRCDGLVAAAAFLFNPLTVASCLGQPTILFTNCAILLAIAQAVQKKPASSMLFLALGSYLSIYPALLLPPMLFLSTDKPVEKGDQQSSPLILFTRYTATFLGGVSFLLGTSFAITGGSWEFLSSTYAVQLLLPDLTPNVGLWWYFFIEMFDSFREFFLGVFWLHLSCYMGGLTFRLRKQPLFVIVMMLGLFAIFKPYPSIADTSLYFAMLPLYRHIFPLMRYTFVAIATLLYATFLGPAFYYLWIYAGSGNANFFYAITLVWSLGLSLIVTDSLFAILRDEWEVERPEMNGRDIRQI